MVGFLLSPAKVRVLLVLYKRISSLVENGPNRAYRQLLTDCVLQYAGGGLNYREGRCGRGEIDPKPCLQ